MAEASEVADAAMAEAEPAVAAVAAESADAATADAEEVAAEAAEAAEAVVAEVAVDEEDAGGAEDVFLKVVAVEVVASDDEDGVGEDDVSEAVVAEPVDDGEDSDDAPLISRKRKASDADRSPESGGRKSRSKSSKKVKGIKVHVGSGAHKGESVPSLRQLAIPFRNTKRTMKLNVDPSTIIQQEAAILSTYAMELFVTKFAKDSLGNARKKGRQTIRYEDVAEARANDSNLNFLDYLIP